MGKHRGGRASSVAERRTRTAQAVRQPRPPKPTKPLSATARKTLVTKQLVQALGPDEKAAVTAALEVVSERLAWDSDLQQSLREKYGEIAALATATGTRTKDLGPLPVPIRSVGLDRYTPYGKFDPYQLVYEYGAHQLRAVLVRGTQKDLREATDIVQTREPGTKPASRTKSADMIDYIMRHVAGTGY